MRLRLLEDRSKTMKWIAFLFVASVVLGFVGVFSNFADVADFAKTVVGIGKPTTVHVQVAAGIHGDQILNLPEILLREGVYQNDSFVNEQGIVPAFWGGRNVNESQADEFKHFDTRPTYGPCYTYDHTIDWKAEIDRFNKTKEPLYNEQAILRTDKDDLQGYCRPGFIIIGAGKCGTSSLYHYIVEHPRVLPAIEKQIHYFKYHSHSPLKWYYSHFPKASSFLAAGALMSGEASPGYLPYPDVVTDMRRRMKTPRILMIGRDPVERAYSSYKYNYVDPTIQYLSKGQHEGIKKGESDEFYHQYLFSFEDMMRAELAVLKECFAPGSTAEKQTRRKWGQQPKWVSNEYARREKAGLPPLIDLDGFCYGPFVSKKVIRKQWMNLVAEQPDKVIVNRNVHLTQAFIGRSLYLFPLEWWYAAFPKDHIYFVCTEELEDFSGESMNNVGSFLGLPRYDNFSEVVKAGAFNVGGHHGYDNEISWDKIEKEQAKDEIPLSGEFRKELEDFIQPYNERLFEMTGRRCQW